VSAGRQRLAVRTERRRWLRATGAGALLLALPPARAAEPTPESQALRAAVLAWTGGAEPRSGRVAIDIASLVENGNSVPVTLAADSPMTADDHVRAIALFSERNPLREMIVCEFTPASGRAQVATRVRLTTSQRLTAVARYSDGSYWARDVDVIVTLAACIEG
jgi:sulfur-oxidizing protein SoxY